MSGPVRDPGASASHVSVDEDGVAWIDDSRVKVIEVVLEKLAHGWSPEEIHFQHPDLSLAQIHAALSWYEGHQEQLDAEIAARLQSVEQEAAAASAEGSPLRARLRRAGRLR
jgi:uncharacterized protein (DUF433 family)